MLKYFTINFITIDFDINDYVNKNIVLFQEKVGFIFFSFKGLTLFVLLFGYNRKYATVKVLIEITIKIEKLQ